MIWVSGPPTSVELVDFPEAFVSGEPKPLSCRVTGSRPYPSLEWFLTKPGEPDLLLETQVITSYINVNIIYYL